MPFPLKGEVSVLVIYTEVDLDQRIQTEGLDDVNLSERMSTFIKYYIPIHAVIKNRLRYIKFVHTKRKWNILLHDMK